MTHDFKQNPLFSLQPQQKMQLSLAMQQSLDVLQMPIEDLSLWLQAKVEQNPLLEWEEPSKELEEPSQRKNSSKSTLLAFDIPYLPSLFEHLMNQARQSINDPLSLQQVEWIIGNLETTGFFTLSFDLAPIEWDRKELSLLLLEVQKLDPIGIAAKDMQESLLLQLKAVGKEKSLSYSIIQDHLEDLVQGRLSQIQKKCKVEEEALHLAIRCEIASLDPFPGLRFQKKESPSLIPDVFLIEEENSWKIEINEQLLPAYCIKPFPLTDQTLSREDQQFIKHHKMDAKWAFYAIEKRRETLRKITEYLVKRQKNFLKGDSETLEPLTIQEIAEETGLHDSTITRAISGKYLSCLLGIIPLKSLFSKSINKSSEHVSCDQALKLLQKLVLEEDKQEPLSDRELLEKMRKIGVPCARRTVTKYRQQLRIPSRRFRKRCQNS